MNPSKAEKSRKRKREENRLEKKQLRAERKRRKRDQRGQHTTKKTRAKEPVLTVTKHTTSKTAETSWNVSDPVGGRFINAPAAFSADERHIFFTTERTASVALINQSLIEDHLDLKGSGCITSVVGSRRHQESAFVGSTDNKISFWRWSKHRGKEIKAVEVVKTQSPVFALDTALLHRDIAEIAFTAESGTRRWSIWAHSTEATPRKSLQLLKQRHPIQAIKVDPSGKVVVAATAECLFIGRLAKEVKATSLEKSLHELEYSWQKVECKEPPTCLDFRFTRYRRDSKNEQSITPVRAEDRLDIAYGALRGCIYLHVDMPSNTATGNGRASLVPRALHWHREAVGAVALSPDGNYLVSGGQETVLVLWQLDTSQKTFLPHLESPIRSLSISPSGSLYAVGLADNSIMVLPTAELKPIAHFASVQSASSSLLTDHRLILPTKETLSSYLYGQASTNLACAVHPSSPTQILLATPSHQSANTTIFPNTPPSPYLQTYDTFRNLHVSRQALTRTNVTSTNLGPDGNKLLEPDVTHLAMAPSGRWLATVDEWVPPRDDMLDLAAEPSELEDEIAKQREVRLQIWSWHDKHRDWMLNTIFPSPHESPPQGRGAARVLALVAKPAEGAFATTGEDGIVRIWAPKTRKPDGKIIRGEGLEIHKWAPLKTQTWWALRHTIPLEGRMLEEPLSTLIPRSSCLAWSDDGSLIAAWLGYPATPKMTRKAVTAASDDDMDNENLDLTAEMKSRDAVQFIDADAGIIRDAKARVLPSRSVSQPGTSPDTIESLAFADRHLLILSRAALYVWDLPLLTLTTVLPLPLSPRKAPPPRLAVNSHTDTFAITISSRKKPNLVFGDSTKLPPHAHRDFTSNIQVFSLPTSSGTQTPTNKENTPPIRQLLDTTLPHLALALLSAGGIASYEDQPPSDKIDTTAALRKGYLVVDSNACIRRIKPPIVSKALAAAMAAATDADETSDLDGTTEINSQGLSAQPWSAFGFRGNEEEEEGFEDGAREEPRQQPRVVPSQKLAEAIGDVEGPNGAGVNGGPALPSVREMYDRVLGLFWGKEKD